MRLFRYFAISVMLSVSTIPKVYAEDRRLARTFEHRIFNNYYNSHRTRRDEERANALALDSEGNDFQSAAESIAAAENSIDAGIKAEEARESMREGKKSFDGTNSEGESLEDLLKDIDKRMQRGNALSSDSQSQRSSRSTDSQNTEEPGMKLEAIVVEHDDSNKESFAPNSIPTTSSDKPSDTKESGLKSYFKSRISDDLDRLMSESSGLANELRGIFDSMEAREILLFAKLDKLKTGMSEALKKLNASKARIRRDDSGTPYKACVSIESDDAEHSNAAVVVPAEVHETPSEPIVREYIGPETNKEDLLEYRPAENSWSSLQEVSSMNETVQESQNVIESSTIAPSPSPSPTTKVEEASAIDLNNVYWMKLPSSEGEDSVEKRVEKVFSEVSGEGKDVLIIPVSRHFNSKHDVSEEFFKAVAETTPGLRFLRRRRLRSLRHFQLKLKRV